MIGGEKKWSTIKLSEQLTDIKSQDDDSIIVTGVGFVEEYTSAGDLLKHTSIGSSGKMKSQE